MTTPRRALLLAALSLALASPPGVAAADDSPELAALQAVHVPVAEVVDLALRNETSFGIGPHSRTANFTYLEPSFPTAVTTLGLDLAHVIRLPLVWQPVNVARTGGTYGLSDLEYQVLLTPAHRGQLTFGVGGIGHVPTATDVTIGDHKWGLGPAAAVHWSGGPLLVGATVTQQWTFASAGNYPVLNRLTLQPTVSWGLGRGWAVVTSPIITADWKRPAGDRWMVPVGGGVQKMFSIGGTRVGLRLEGYGYALKPGSAFVAANPLINVPEWMLRAGLNILIPR